MVWTISFQSWIEQQFKKTGQRVWIETRALHCDITSNWTILILKKRPFHVYVYKNLSAKIFYILLFVCTMDVWHMAINVDVMFSQSLYFVKNLI